MLFHSDLQQEAMEAAEKARQLDEADELCRKAEGLAIQRYNQALVSNELSLYSLYEKI